MSISGGSSQGSTGGALNLFSGASAAGASGSVSIASTDAVRNSGDVLFGSGNSYSGVSGKITISTGASETSSAGGISLKVGDSSAAGGSMVVTSGSGSIGGGVAILAGQGSVGTGGTAFPAALVLRNLAVLLILTRQPLLLLAVAVKRLLVGFLSRPGPV